jgi:hypothetical protein
MAAHKSPVLAAAIFSSARAGADAAWLLRERWSNRAVAACSVGVALQRGDVGAND